jgi:hypothetical protein
MAASILLKKKWQHNGSSNTTIHLTTKTIHLRKFRGTQHNGSSNISKKMAAAI